MHYDYFLSRQFLKWSTLQISAQIVILTLYILQYLHVERNILQYLFSTKNLMVHILQSLFTTEQGMIL